MSKLSNIVKAVKPGNISNLRVILLCIFAATTFWFFNALNENYSTTLRYPLHFAYDHEKYVVIEPLPENIQINVSGLGWNLFRNSLGIKVSPLKIPLENPTEVKKIVAASVPGLITDQLDELQLNYVLTDTLFLNIDFKISRKFALTVDSSSISLEENFQIINQIRFAPDSAELTGPENIIKGLPDTLTVKVPQQGIDENYNEDVPIELPNGQLIRRDPPTVNIVFAVEEFVSQEAMIPLQIENIPDKAYIETESVKVSYKMRKSQVENVPVNEEILVTADFESMNPADSTIIAVLKEFPSKIREVQLDTTRIKVHFNE